MSSNAAPMTKEPEDSPLSPEQIVAIVILSLENSSDGSSQTIKLRVHQRDLKSSNNACTGRSLRMIVLDRLGMDETSHLEIQLFDSEKGDFIFLEHPDLFDCNLLVKFGTRLRARALRPDHREGNILAIEGRFYAFDSGIDVGGIRLNVQEDPNHPNGGTAGNVWDGAILLARYIEHQPEMIKSKRVLELGAGCGLVGIAAGVLGANEVMSTDLPHALRLIQKNIDLNSGPLSESGCQMHCLACDWFCPPKELIEWKADVVLVADCVWMQELVAPLLATIKLLMKESEEGVVLISYQRRGKPTNQEFWEGVNSLFSEVNEVDTACVGIHKPASIFLLVCRI